MSMRLGFVAAAFVAAFTAAGTPLCLRVGSYNVRNSGGDRNTENDWALRKADLSALVRSLDLDVFGLQEVLPDQADYLRAELPAYAMAGVHRDDGDRRGEASPVFYRTDRFEAVKSGTFWLSLTPDVPGSMSWGAACTRICSWALLRDRQTGLCLCFCNTHTDHESAEARLEGMLLIIRRMKEFSPPGTPIVFTGDHNCFETDPPAVAMAEQLNNAMLASETQPQGPWRSFNGWTWKECEVTCAEALHLLPAQRNSDSFTSDAGGRIDYIYVSDGVRVKAFATHGDVRPGTHLYPSDHFPVTAAIEIPARQDVQRAAVAAAAQDESPQRLSWTHYRFKVDEVYGRSAIGMQISELALLCNGEDVTRKCLSAVSRGPRVPQAAADAAQPNGGEYWNSAGVDAAEGVAKAVDGALGTKFYDCNASFTRSNAEYRDKCWVRLDYTNALRVTSYRWATGNDNVSTSSANCRSPRAFRLQGSDDGETWTDLDVRTGFSPPATTNTWTETFRLPGTAARGGYSTDAKWFRLTILRKQDNAIWSAQLAEFALYDDAGARVNAGLTAVAKDTSAAALNPGEATASEPAGATHGGEGEENGGFGKLFDGDLSTKYICGCTLDDTRRIVVTLHLRDDAAATCGYGFVTAADAGTFPGRNPNSWTLEASRDGTTWFMLDARRDVETPAANGVPYNGGVPYLFQGKGDRPAGELETEGRLVPDVPVEAGATWLVGDAGVRIGGLTVDCLGGVGMIDRLNAAETGELRLVNGAGLPLYGMVLPVAIAKISNGGYLANWGVFVDGVPRRDVRLAEAGGRGLVLNGLGTRLLVR